MSLAAAKSAAAPFLVGPAHERLQRLGRLGHGHIRLIVIRAELEICVDCRVPFVGRFEDPKDHPDGVVVATVVKDPEGAVCDNSCEFANDGVCDDGTAASGKQRQRVKEEGDWEDDIYGNYFYGEDGGDNDDDFHEYDDDYYGAGYDYYNYGYGDDDDEEGYGYGAPVCDPGTDCDDCSAAAVNALNNPSDRCDNTCSWSKDGVCDDARVKGPCALGTDCQDQCGNQPVRQAGLEVLFTILAASTQRESAMRPRTRRRRLTHPNV